MTEPRVKHPVLLYLVIACIPPWIGWSLMAFGVIPQNSPWSGPIFLTGEAVSIAGLAVTFMTQGSQGVLSLLKQAVRAAVPIQWWLYALLLPPSCSVATGILYLMLHGKPIVFKPSAFLQVGTPALLVPFLFGPLGEEFGWRGFLLPRFVRKFSAVPACFFVGIIWAVWHWPLYYKAIAKSPAEEIFFMLANITGLSFLLGVVYLRTNSLLFSMLMHWSSNATLVLVGGLLPDLPSNALNDIAFRWCGLGVLTLCVAAVIPLLLRTDRRSPPIIQTAEFPAAAVD